MRGSSGKRLIGIKANDMLDLVMKTLGSKTDAQLARDTGISQPNICKMRSGLNPVGASTILQLHLLTDIPIRTLKEIAGLRSLERIVS